MFSIYRSNKKDIEKEQAALKKENARRNAFSLICTLDNLAIDKTVKLSGYMIYRNKLVYVSFFKFPFTDRFNFGYIVNYRNKLLVLDNALRFYILFKYKDTKSTMLKKGLTYHKSWYFNTNREKEILYTARKLFKNNEN